jgi:hypothetical protein
MRLDLRAVKLGLPVVFAAIATLTLAGCSAQKVLDATSIEAQIVKDVAASRGVEVKVSCPGQVKAEKGGVFTCRATDGAGHSLPIRAIQTDNSGHISWNLVALNIRRVNRELTKSISLTIGAPVRVDCPAILVDGHAGNKIECVVTDRKGRTARVVARVVNDQGKLSWQLM